MMSRTIRNEIRSYSSVHRFTLLKIFLIILKETLTSSASSLTCNSTSGRGCACEGQQLSISCTNSVIRISGANYGRLDNKTCSDGLAPSYASWNLNCTSSTSTEIVSKECNNRRDCNFKSSGYNTLFGEDPCSATGKYLIVNYTCEPAATFSTEASDEVTTKSTNATCQCTNETKRKVDWPVTVCDNQTTQSCPNNKKRTKAIRYCSKDGKGVINMIGCITEEIEAMAEELKNLTINFSINATTKMMTRVENISKSNDLYGGDLYELTKVMIGLVELAQNKSRNFTTSDADNMIDLVINSTSSLLSNGSIEAWNELLPSNQSQTATRLLLAMEDSSEILAKATVSPRSLNKTAPGIDALQIDVINVSEEAVRRTHPTFTFKASDSQFEISLKDVIERAHDGLGRTAFIQYNNITKWLHISKSNDNGRQNPDDTDEKGNETHIEPYIITKVLSASVISYEEHSTKLKNSIRFTLNHKSEAENSTEPSCVFWKFSKKNFDGHWSNEGCTVISSNRDNTTCECDHLTNFAVLMSRLKIPEGHEFALHVITYIGCSISIFFLVIALCTFCFFRNLQSDRNTIHKNLVLCLLIAELIFVIGIIQHKQELLCAFFTGFLHYFFLASFAWMCLEGAQLYILLIEVFETEKSRVKWYYLGGYGIPALIVVISVSFNIYMKENNMFKGNDDWKFPYGAYGTKEFCWLSNEWGFIWAFNGPIIAIFAVNAVMLGMAIYMMCKHARATVTWKSKDRSKISSIGSWVRGAAILIVLLGTTWIFGLGLLYESGSSLIMQYLFTIFNSLQGLFIFVFHCLINDKVQKEYRRAIQRSTWLPECVRVKCGDLSGSGPLSAPNQSTSSGTKLFQRMFPKNKRNENQSHCPFQKLDSSSSDNRGQISFSSLQGESRSSHDRHHVGTASEFAHLTDSSGFESRDSDSFETSENANGYVEPAITSERGFYATDRSESSFMNSPPRACITFGRPLNLKEMK